jgi:hypothetical protein
VCSTEVFGRNRVIAQDKMPNLPKSNRKRYAKPGSFGGGVAGPKWTTQIDIDTAKYGPRIPAVSTFNNFNDQT